MNAPLSTLQSASALACRMRKAAMSALERSDYDRYQREMDRLMLAMDDPNFDKWDYVALCKQYGVDWR